MDKFSKEDLIVLYEDNHVIVVVKPQNVPVCEDESKDPDLLSIIKEYLKDKYDKQGNVYLGLVHRLDRPTGGAMVFAKTSKAASRLAEQMKTGDFEKRYLTVVCGAPKNPKDRLVHYIKKNDATNMVYVVPISTTDAKRAELEYEVLESKCGYSFLIVSLLTGRSHQIRVQMNAIGTPVYGDMRYGGEKAKKGHLALWAYELSFSHPVLEERLVFKVEPPKDIAPWKAFDTEKLMMLIK